MRSVLPMLVFVWAVTYTNTATFAQSVTPAFNSKSLRDAQKGLITQVLTLGSVHLAQVEKKPKAEELDGLLDKLEAFKPDIITLEGLSGEQCDQMERYRALYGRQHAAQFETRNLRMVANVRAAFGNKLGSRVLNIVGASRVALQ